MRALLTLLICLPLSLSGQVGRGTLFQSIAPVQNAGVNSVRLPGNPSITTNEILAWDRGDPLGGCRAIYNAQHLGVLFGDRNGDGLPFDWPDIDALCLDPMRVIPPNTQPTAFDFFFSVSADVQNNLGVTILRAGDIFRFTGVNGFSVVVSESALQAAMGTSGRLNVDGLDMMPDGALLVSFRGSGTGNNIINPLSGNPGSNVNFTGADLFLIRVPYGTASAIFAWRASDLQPITSFYGYPALTEISGVAIQPGTTLVANPWDPRRLYQGGNRPMPLWLVEFDDQVFCFNANLNPRTTADHFYALLGLGAVSRAGYSTNTSNSRVLMDAIEVGDFELTNEARLTLDASSLNPTGGQTFSLAVRGADAPQTLYQILFSGSLDPTAGLALGSATARLHLRASDPLFLFGLDPLVAPLFVTGPSDAEGTALSANFILPNAPGVFLHFQAIKLGGGFPISGPLSIRIN